VLSLRFRLADELRQREALQRSIRQHYPALACQLDDAVSAADSRRQQAVPWTKLRRSGIGFVLVLVAVIANARGALAGLPSWLVAAGIGVLAGLAVVDTGIGRWFLGRVAGLSGLTSIGVGLSEP
jgi:hypothetical protein